MVCGGAIVLHSSLNVLLFEAELAASRNSSNNTSHMLRFQP